jgi:hypothetical protein
MEDDVSFRLRPDIHGDGAGDYRLASLYYDSSDRRCYWEKVEGLKFRRKLRLRRYLREETFGDRSPVFAEIKQRSDRTTQKRRLILPYGQARILCGSGEADPDTNNRIDDPRSGGDRSLMGEIEAFVREYGLQPACVVSYRRRAFMGSALNPGLRITFDSDLRVRTGDLDLRSTESGKRVLSQGLVIIEVKANDRIPNWLTETIAARNLRLVRISKYVVCIDAADHRTAAVAKRINTGNTDRF